MTRAWIVYSVIKYAVESDRSIRKCDAVRSVQSVVVHLQGARVVRVVPVDETHVQVAAVRVALGYRHVVELRSDSHVSKYGRLNTNTVCYSRGVDYLDGAGQLNSPASGGVAYRDVSAACEAAEPGDIVDRPGGDVEGAVVVHLDRVLEGGHLPQVVLPPQAQGSAPVGGHVGELGEVGVAVCPVHYGELLVVHVVLEVQRPLFRVAGVDTLQGEGAGGRVELDRVDGGAVVEEAVADERRPAGGGVHSGQLEHQVLPPDRQCHEGVGRGPLLHRDVVSLAVQGGDGGEVVGREPHRQVGPGAAVEVAAVADDGGGPGLHLLPGGDVDVREGGTLIELQRVYGVAHYLVPLQPVACAGLHQVAVRVQHEVAGPGIQPAVPVLDDEVAVALDGEVRAVAGELGGPLGVQHLYRGHLHPEADLLGVDAAPLLSGGHGVAGVLVEKILECDARPLVARGVDVGYVVADNVKRHLVPLHARHARHKGS